MKIPLLLFIGLLGSISSLYAEGEPFYLRWRNSETISGKIAGGSGAELLWRTPLFEEPLPLQWSALSRVEGPVHPSPNNEPFGVVLRDGSYICGDLLSISGTAVKLRGERHGLVELKRAEVLSIHRLKGVSLIHGGPPAGAGWKEVMRWAMPVRGRKTAMTRVGPGGSLLLPYWDSEVQLPIELPERGEIEFQVQSDARPNFTLALSTKADQGVRVDTWNEELVLCHEDKFQLARKLGENQIQVSLRFCWDFPGRTCSLFGSNGDLLSQLDLPGPVIKPAKGLSLRNKGKNLTLEYLRIRKWDGKSPPKVDLAHPRVVLTDGTAIAGELATNGSLAIRKTDGAKTPLSLEELQEIVFATEPPKPGKTPMKLSFSDGTLLFGTVTAIENDEVTLSTAIAEKPLRARLDGYREIRIDVPPSPDTQPPAPLKDLDKISAWDTVLSGKAIAESDSSMRWMPIGGTIPVRPSPSAPYRIIRTFPTGAEVKPAAALFYTKWGDKLPGSLVALDNSGVEIKTDVAEITKFSAEQLNAIQLSPRPSTAIKSFLDPGWKILKGNSTSVQRKGGNLHMEEETMIGHPTAMHNDAIEFTIRATGWAVIRLRLFCAGTDPKRSSSLMLVHLGSEMRCGLETNDGEFSGSNGVKPPRDGFLRVRIAIHPEEVEVAYDGMAIERFPMPLQRRAGYGLILEPASVWGNRISPLDLESFSAPSGPGRVTLPPIDPETKIHALTIPRLRKESPPKHLLVAANGDLLRGEIDAITHDHLGFRCGLETLSVPRNRVEAIILPAKSEGETFPEKKRAAVSILDQPIEARGSYRDTKLNELISVLQSAMPSVRFKWSSEDDQRTATVRFRGQTLRVALKEICGQFDLGYRVDEEGAIVLERGEQRKPSTIRHSYWLTEAPFSDVVSARKSLLEKGVSHEVEIEWDLLTRRLIVTGPPEMQTRVSSALDAYFGGVQRAPTHLLRLTNGASFSLAVDKFDAAAVTGTHPLYGNCVIPMEEVCEIDASLPDPSATAEKWRFVSASEPVLPESGGENSPVLGKEAATFKLSLVDGGEFDLSKVKGKVVVLDFWATWCGPCIKSLPDMIESMSQFSAEEVVFVGLNQGEPAAQVKRFLETRGWKMTVALDATQNVGRQYAVDGIPHTLIIDPNGKIVWVKSGYSPTGAAEAAEAVKRLLKR